MHRQELMYALADAGVEFPPTATIAQLKRLNDNMQKSRPTSATNEDMAEDESPTTAVTRSSTAVHPTAIHGTTGHTAEKAAASTAEKVAVRTAAKTAVNTAEKTTAEIPVGATAAANADMAAEVERLRMQLEITCLRRQLADLETDADARRGGKRQLHYGDIEGAIVKFSGDDVSHPVANFLNDFEEIVDSMDGDDQSKLLALRRSLIGTAKTFFSTTVALSYQELKAALLREFMVPISRGEVYKMLANRHWRPLEESLHGYVLTIQAIGKRADIEEAELVDNVLEGAERYVDTTLLVSARDLTHLKQLVSRHQKRLYKRTFLTAAKDPQPPSRRLQTINNCRE